MIAALTYKYHDIISADVRHIGNVQHHLIHTGAPGNAYPFAADKRLSGSAGKAGGNAVGIARGDDCYNRVSACGEFPAIADAFACFYMLYQGYARFQGYNGLEL